ncbi:hypothetical protein JW890_07890 [candidate division WOR-3 bacterium]|nr:hypothetical protein [candidate division WOR-3 bacterium]
MQRIKNDKREIFFLFLIAKRKPENALAFIRHTISEAKNQWGFASPAVFRHWGILKIEDLMDYAATLQGCSGFDFSGLQKLRDIKIEDVFNP